MHNKKENPGLQLYNFNKESLTTNEWKQAIVRESQFTSHLQAWHNSHIEFSTDATHFVFVYDGRVDIDCQWGKFQLPDHFFAAVPGPGCLHGAGKGIVISRSNFSGWLQMGGPAERTGRLRYIDGCTDSLLIAPTVKGDPCLNLLHIPPGTHQTRHTHPSVRMGLILSGYGHCITPDKSAELFPGSIFLIPADCQHSFHTDHSELRVIAYHPDSDTGPSHLDHPMVNRTIIDGRPATQWQDILTE